MHSLRAELQRHDGGNAGGRMHVLWPTERLRLFPFRPGQTVAVEISQAGDAMYEVDTLVESASTEEPPSLVLRMRGEWQRVQRRHSVRHAVDMRPSQARRLDAAHAGAPLVVSITDLSAGGMRLLGSVQLTPGEEIELTFGTPSGGAELRLRVSVVRVQSVGSEWDVGCQFVEPKAVERERIVQFILAQQDAIARS
jgi:c-di-GMP-binding flagellar brake protein YcgR